MYKLVVKCIHLKAILSRFYTYCSHPPIHRGPALSKLESHTQSPPGTDLPEYSVIMTRRSATLRGFPSASAFPGGNVDNEDK